MPFFLRNQASVKYGAVPGAEAATVLPFRSLIEAMSLRTAMPSAPYDLSSWKICLVATPLAFQAIQVSTVVAAHWMSPEAMARCRSFCGIFLIDTSRPLALKMPASLASVRGAKPVQPEMPMATWVSWADAVPPNPTRAARAVALIRWRMKFLLVRKDVPDGMANEANLSSKDVAPSCRAAKIVHKLMPN